MALTIGTNSGFVISTPSGNPEASTFSLSNTKIVIKDTSPSTATKITEVGFYFLNPSATTPGVNFEVGLYSPDGAVVPGEAGTLLYASQINDSGTVDGWLSVAVDWDISPSTVYWIGIQIDTMTGIRTQYKTSGGYGIDYATSSSTLSNPFGGGSIYDINGAWAVYAKWSSGVSGPANLKSYNTNLKANIKTINTNPIANVKSLNTNV